MSSPDPPFTPRKEFIRDQRTTNTFALLAISGSSLIRLYSFPDHVITALRRLFHQHSLMAAFREDVSQNFSEFTLDGKPWASPKSINAEKLLLEFLAIIYQHGYHFLSTIDYGREHDDRLAMAFSRPALSSSSPRSGSPLPGSPLPAASGSSLSQSTSSSPSKVPFALSFPSATMLRVINPPLHSTPAILQAVRGSWPRGVVSEKKIGEASYEFKLKGYKWFQEDTFATDSLRHILSLLSSLDTHAFTLLCSLSLSNRSRVKDLWIFTGPGPSSSDAIDPYFPDSPAPSTNNSNLELKRGIVPEPPKYTQMPTDKVHNTHRRMASAPGGGTSQPQPLPPAAPHPPAIHLHARAATESGIRHNVPATPFQNPFAGNLPPPSPLSPLPSPQVLSSGMLRKPAPRAQVPVSIASEDHIQVHPSGPDHEHRIMLPSTVGSVENMTGVGTPSGRVGRTPDVFYETAPNGGTQEGERSDYLGFKASSPAVSPPTRGSVRSRSASPPNRGRSPLRPVSTRSKTPPLLSSHSPASSPGHPQMPTSFLQSHSTTPPSRPSPAGSAHLLAAGVFATDTVRDSAFSSMTGRTEGSHDIPIKWTGDLKPEATVHEGDEDVDDVNPGAADRMSVGPTIPGGWASTPEEEKPEPAPGSKDGYRPQDASSASEATGQRKEPERPLQEVGGRVASPELIHPGEKTRKSEAGLVGVISANQAENPRPMDVPREMSGTGQGWVLVSVEGKKGPDGSASPTDSAVSRSAETASGSPTPHARTSPPSNPNLSSMSSAAKAIVIIDAVDAKERAKAKSKSHRSSSPSGLRKILGMSRSGKGDNSDSALVTATSPDAMNGDGEKNRGKSKQRDGLREKLKKLGTPEAKTSEGKRVSVN